MKFGKGFRVVLGNRHGQAAQMVIAPADAEGGPTNRHPVRDPTGYRFKQRAQTYAGWDRELRDKTRFFAAASITNHVLDAVARITFPVRLSKSAGALLDSLGESLEKPNRGLAEQVMAERRSGVVLDEWIVKTEQSLVETFLAQTAIAAPATVRRVTAELDGMLNAISPWSLCDSMFPSVCGYLAVLRHVRDQVGPRIHFSQQAHRVRIGQQLIASIRGGAIYLAA